MQDGESTTEQLTGGDWPQLLDYVLRKCRPPTGSEMETPPYDAYTAGIVMRVGTLLRGVRALLREGLAVEAGFLARALFTDSLRLQHLADAGGERAGIVLGWHLQTLADFEGNAREAYKAGVSPDLKATLAALEKQREQARRFARREGIEIKKRGFPSDKQLAQRYGRQEAYVDYRYSHHVVHGSTVALIQRHRIRGSDGAVEIGVQPRGDDKDALEAVAWFACDSALHARLAADRIFGWAEPPGIRDLLTAINDERRATARGEQRS